MHHAAHIHSHQRAQYNDDRQIWDLIWPLFPISRKTKARQKGQIGYWIPLKSILITRPPLD